MPKSTAKNTSGTPSSESNLTLGQAVGSYLSGLTQDERTSMGSDINNFVRWYGAERPMRSITPPDLERYQEQMLAEARTGVTGRLEALRAFLTEAKRQHWTDTNLAVSVKLKRKKGVGRSKSTSESSDSDAVRLTPEGFRKLQEELVFLETDMRHQVANELRTAAADKDFRENAPYDVAKQHQGEVEARIRELKRILETGQVVRDTGPAHLIDIGSKVTLRDLAAEDEEIVYTIVGPGEIDPRKGKISVQSPVGRALAGKTVGDEVEVSVPAGTVRFRIEKVEDR